MKAILLDGPLGTELAGRGVPTPLPRWSADALLNAPDAVRAIHADYAAAGAQVHTANTFRTRAATLGEAWSELATLAVRLAREACGPGARVAGSIAPLEDCYRPDASPADREPSATRAEHARLSGVLAAAGCDLLLCESFPHVGEGWLALEAAVETGLESWCSFTPGWDASLLTPAAVADGARGAIERGAAAVLVNCLPIPRALDYARALAEAASAGGVPFGCYANAGVPDERVGWASSPPAVERYAAAAGTWLEEGASIVGGCCGTGPAHVAALAGILGRREEGPAT
ncbi:MAG: homocysteine S-methyltransferase family protein [Planctomycetota bacterium]|nr:homocysteine S-methyltransferase family protein [Planctomycetota bacterium]